jgi:MYXO-CTERM domain-containing protein
MSYLETITTAWSSLDSTQAMLQRLKLDSAFEKSVSNLDKAIDDFDTAVTAMKAAGTEDAKKAKMGDLKAPLLAAQAAVTDLNDRVGKANGLALPTTGSDSKTPIDVAIKRDGSTAESLQILVGTGSLVPAATNTKSSQSLTGDKTATPAPSGAQTQGQPTAASGGQSSGTTGQSGASQSGGTTAGAAANPAVPGSGMSGAGALASGSTPAPGQAENPANPADPASMASNAGAAADSQSVNTSNSAQAVATWTPGPDGSQAVAQLADDPAASPISTSSGGGGGGSGPNIAIIAVGALVLVGAALWLRRRM